jgi:hypothetical protein
LLGSNSNPSFLSIDHRFHKRYTSGPVLFHHH